MTMEKIVIFGCSGQAKVVADIIEQEQRYAIVGLIAPSQPVGERFFDYPILGEDREILELQQRYSFVGGIVALGDNFLRQQVTENIQQLCPSFKLLKAIHPKATLGRDVAIGVGTVVMANAVINSGSRVGQGCIINTASVLEHDGVLADYASLGPKAAVGGGVQIGKRAVVAIGATVLQGMTVGADSVLGAGSVLTKDLPANKVAYGVPARIIRERNAAEKYLK